MNKETVVAIDPCNPIVLTLDPWPQYVFIAANGQMTIIESVYYMTDKYPGDIPGLLDKTIIDEMLALPGYAVIELVGTKQPPKHESELSGSDR